MRAIPDLTFDLDRQLEDAARAKQQLDTERWREDIRPRAMRLFAARTARITWSRALVKLVVGELYPDDLFTQLIGHLDRVPRRRWPQVVAVAVALRHSWRRDSLARIARRLSSGSRRRRTSSHRVHSANTRSSAHTRRRVRQQSPRSRAGALTPRERK